MDDAEQFLPLYLRFVKGVVDSSDLPLNVSRELLQQDPEVEAISGGLTKRVLDLLARLAKDEPEKYATLLEGIRRGAQGRPGPGPRQPRAAPAVAALCQHAPGSDDEPTVSLADYVERMKPGQERIYFVIAESLAAARGSPYIEQLQGARPRSAAAGRAHRRVGDGPAR